MRQDKTLTSGARAVGAVALSALALLGLGWIIRDFVAAAEVTDVWWTWSGLPPRASDGLWATSFVEPTLVVLYVVSAVAAVRTSAAAGVLASAGALTVLLRAPSLWNLNSAWMMVVDGGTKQWAITSVIASVALGAALMVVAALGRRPVAAGGGTVACHEWEDDTPPARPTRGGALMAFLLLGGAGLALMGWELHTAAAQGWALYQRAVTGEGVLVALLSVPASWYAWATALSALAGAVAAVLRAPLARPLGMAVSALLTGLGLFYTSYALQAELFQHLGERSPLEQLRVGLALFEILAGLGALCALGPRGDAEEGDGHPMPASRDYSPGMGPGLSPPPPASPPANR